jgi:methyltransferase (TIGR00027 family)
MHDPLIRSIADTARWIAYHRAEESERPDALFSDPYARKLAGERGELIGKQMNNAMYIAIRTLLFDTLILEQLAQAPIDMVVNLAAGLDSRAYRLKLPHSLRWVEIDLPEIVDIKKVALAGEKTSCALDVFALDLAEALLRQRLFTKLNAQATLAMVLSEGLLMYLTEEQVTDLAANIRAQPHFKYWVVEVVSPSTIEWVQQTWGRHLAAAGAPMIFAPGDWESFYAKRGWRVIDFRDIPQHAVKYGRNPGPSTTRAKIKHAVRAIRQKLQRVDQQESGVAVLEKI